MTKHSPTINEMLAETPPDRCIICDRILTQATTGRPRRMCRGECTTVYMKLYWAARRDRFREVEQLARLAAQAIERAIQ
jgi:hypothetical protein